MFRWQREVELPALTATSVIAVELDEHFHSSTRIDWPDYRLRDDQGRNIGGVIGIAQEVETKPQRQSFAAKSLQAHVSEEHGLQVEFTLDEKDPLPSVITITTPLRDFEHQVRVESSADGVTWTPAGEPTLIFDYSQYIDARNVDVPVKGGEHRRFRLTIADITAEQETQLLELNRRLRGGQEAERNERTAIQRRPFRVDRLTLSHTVQTVSQLHPRIRIYPATDFVVSQNEKDKETIVTFAVNQQPIESLRLLIADENFNRAVRVEWESTDTQGEQRWTGKLTGTLTRFQVGSIRRESLEIPSPTGTVSAQSLPGHRADRIRVTIENADSPPLNITGVEPLGPIRELKFLASPGQKPRLVYGSPDATAGQMDVAALQEALRQGLPVQTGQLTAPREDPAAPVAGKPTWKPWNDPNVLFGGIVVLTLLLAWGLYRASNRITLPPEGP